MTPSARSAPAVVTGNNIRKQNQVKESAVKDVRCIPFRSSQVKRKIDIGEVECEVIHIVKILKEQG